MVKDQSIYSQFLMNEEVVTFNEPIEAFIIYSNFRINLINGEKEEVSSDIFLQFLQELKISNRNTNPIVIHLFYEFYQELINANINIVTSNPLAIYIQYQPIEKKKPISIYKKEDKISLQTVDLFKEKNYKDQFSYIRDRLVDGDCYQVNLTNNCYFKLDREEMSVKGLEENFWSRKDSLSKMAHLTYIDSLNKMFISNSPECLFTIGKDREGYNLKTYPIKGTVNRDQSLNKAEQISQILEDKKNRCELNIITDLMRNDLSKLSEMKTDVLNSSAVLEVPGLIHLYSIIKTKLNEQKTLLDILRAVFPGGSITGAPKKRVLEIINEIETNSRGFYTGSTILWYDSTKVASINIRSAEIDLDSRELKYGCGGGVTLLSKMEEEYEESFRKLESFIKVFFHLKF